MSAGTYTTANGGGRVAELENSIAACRRENGKLRSSHAEELGRRHALTADLRARDFTIAHLNVDIAQLRAENVRLSADLATARARSANPGTATVILKIVGHILGRVADATLNRVFGAPQLRHIDVPDAAVGEPLAISEQRVRALVRDELNVMAADILADIEPTVEKLGVFDDPVIGETYRTLFGRK